VIPPTEDALRVVGKIEKINLGFIIVSTLQENNVKNSKCVELESTNERLAKDLRAREQAMSSLTDQMNQVKLSSSRSSPQARTSISQSVSRTTSVGTTDSLSGTNDNDSLRSEISQLQAEVASLRNAAVASRPRGFGTSTSFGAGGAAMDVNRIRALNDEIATWKTRSENLMAELKTAQRKAAAAEAEAERASERAARAGEAQAKADTQLKSAQAEVTQLRELAQQSTRNLQDQLKRSEGDSIRFAADADKVSTQAVVLQRRIDALMTEKTSLENTAADALASATKARDAARLAKANEEEMAKLLEDKSVQLAQLYAEMERLKTGKAASDAQFDALTGKLSSAHDSAAAHEAATKAMAGRAGDASEFAAELDRQLKAERERADAAELAIEALKSQLVVTQAESGSISTTQRATTDALDTAQQQLDALRNEKNAIDASRAATEDAQARLDLKVRELQAQLGQRDATITEMTDVLETLRADLESKSDALATAQAQATHTEGALGSVKSKSTAEISDLHASMAGQSEELDAAIQAKEAAEIAMREAVNASDNARRTALKATQDLAAAQEELHEAKAGLDAESERAEALSQLLSDREAELSSLRQQVAKVEARALQVESLADQSEADQRLLKDANDRHANLSEDLDTAKEEIATKQRALDAALGNVQNCEQKIEKLQQAVKTAEDKTAELQSALEEAEERISQYEEEKAAGAMSVGDARSSARESEMAAADAKRAAQEAAQQLDLVKEELEETKKRLAAAEKTIGALDDAAADAHASASTDLDWKRRAAELSSELDEKSAELEATQTAAAAAKQISAATAVHDEEDHETVAKSLVANVFGKVTGAAAAADDLL
jgi:chromosome segregation ATPase